MNTFKKFFEGMAQAPEGQCDKTLRPRFQALADLDVNPNADDVLRILDDCVRYGLTSDFVVSTLDQVWKMLLIRESRTVAQGLAAATWRTEQL